MRCKSLIHGFHTLQGFQCVAWGAGDQPLLGPISPSSFPWVPLAMLIQVSHCVPIPAADSKWGPWNHWSLCSKTCDTGWQRRFRMCEGTGVQGYPCEGSGEEVKTCNEKKCPGRGCPRHPCARHPVSRLHLNPRLVLQPTTRCARTSM